MIQTFAKKTLKSNFLRKVFTLTVGTVATQVISFLLAPILTRVYSPEDFGLYGLFAAIINIGVVFSTWRYEQGIVVSNSKSERQGLFYLVLLLSLVSSLVVFVVVKFLPRNWFWESTSLNWIISHWSGLLALGLCFSGILLALQFLALKESAFRALSLSQIGLRVMLVGSQLLGGFWPTVVAIGLPLGEVFSLGFGVLWLGYEALRNRWLDFSSYPLNYLRIVAAAKRNDEYPKFRVWSALCNNAAPQVVVLAINFLFSPGAAGQVFLAERVLKKPVALIGKTVADVNLQESSDMMYANLEKVYKSRVRKLLWVGGGIFLLLFVSVPWLIPLIFGDSWHRAGVRAQMRRPGLYVQFVFQPFIPLFTVLRRQGVFLVWSIMRLIFVTAGVLIGSWLGGINGTVIAYSVTFVISYLLIHVLIMSILQRLSSKPHASMNISMTDTNLRSQEK